MKYTCLRERYDSGSELAKETVVFDVHVNLYDGCER